MEGDEPLPEPGAAKAAENGAATAKGDEALTDEEGKHWDLKREASAQEASEKPFVIRFAKH